MAMAELDAWQLLLVIDRRLDLHHTRAMPFLTSSSRQAAALLIALAAPSHRVLAQSPTGSVVVSNMNDNTAMIVDLASRQVVATLPTGEGPHEVAISRDGRLAAVSNYGVRGRPGNAITIIDISSRRVDRTIDLGQYQRPHGMSFLPGDSVLAVTSEVAKAVLLVDLRTNTVRGTLPTTARASHMLGVSRAGDRIVTANIADSTVSVIDPAHAGNVRTIHVAAQPEGIALSPDGAFVWAGSNRDSVVLVADVGRAQVVDTLRGFGLPYRLAFTPDGASVVVSDPVKAQVRVFDARTHRERSTVAIPRDSLVATAEIPGSPSPEGVATSRDGRWAFITLQGRNRLAIIDLSRGVIISLIPIGTWSDGVGFSPVVSR
jgi:YVTN family beta-propeller protein